jgi:predicted transcriptional regulator
MTTTKEQIKAAIETLRAIADTIREAKRIPSGTLYAVLMGKMSLETYEKIIGTLKNTGLVRETESHLLEWAGPSLQEETKQNSLLA